MAAQPYRFGVRCTLYSASTVAESSNMLDYLCQRDFCQRSIDRITWLVGWRGIKSSIITVYQISSGEVLSGNVNSIAEEPKPPPP